MEIIRPLLSLIAGEFAHAAMEVARYETGDARRLERACVLTVDELLFGVRVANLPEIANTWRKFGITYITASTNASDEEALYGPDNAALLREQAGVTIYGGFTGGAHELLTTKAGVVSVVTASKSNGSMGSSISETEKDVLAASDQQQLGDGDSVIDCHGLAPFIAHTKSVYDRYWLYRRIRHETRELVS